jgi:hypothetical protein
MCIMLPGFRDDYVCSSQPTGFLVSNHEVNKNKNDKPISSFIIFDSLPSNFKTQYL